MPEDGSSKVGRALVEGGDAVSVLEGPETLGGKEVGTESVRLPVRTALVEGWGGTLPLEDPETPAGDEVGMESVPVVTQSDIEAVGTPGMMLI